MKGAFRLNWTAPAFLSLLPGAAATLLEMLDEGQTVRARRWRWAAGVTAVACVIFAVFVHFGLATTRVKWVRGGWSQLAERVKAVQATLETTTGQKPFVLGVDKYNMAAEIGFYRHDPQDCVNPYALGAQGLGYRYWTNLEGFRGRPSVIVLTKSDERSLEKLRPHFKKLGSPEIVRIYTDGRLQREVYLVAGYGYSPDHPSDIE